MHPRTSFLRRLPVLLLVLALLVPSVASAQPASEPMLIEQSYLRVTSPYRERMGAYQDMLANFQKLAAAGHLDEITLADLTNLSRELFKARTTFDEAGPTARLDFYHRTILLGLDRSYEATVLLLRAQVTESEADYHSLIRQAGEQTASAMRLLREAADEFRTIFPALAEQPQRAL